MELGAVLEVSKPKKKIQKCGQRGLDVFIIGPNGVRESTCCKARRCGSRFLVTVSRGCVRWDPLIKTPRKEKKRKEKQNLVGARAPFFSK